MKRILVSILLVFALVSCAGWQVMTPNQKLDAVATYYEDFTNGVKLALPWLTFFPGAEVSIPTIVKLLADTDLAIDAYKSAVVLYRAGKVGAAELVAKQDYIWKLVQDINALVGKLKTGTL